MGITQLNFDYQTKIDVVIARLQEFEPPEGYYLAFSGGKDSITIYDLAVKAGVKFDAHYNMTGIDPPELIHFIRQQYSGLVECHRPSISIYQEVRNRGMPWRTRRWCCELLKESGGEGRRIVTGIRWAESARRRQRRRMFEICNRNKTKSYLNPIIDLTDSEVWEYIKSRNIPYCCLYDEGFTRLGCVLCPLSSERKAKIEAARWPKIAEAWHRAAIRFWERGTPGTRQFNSGDELFAWWLSRKARNSNIQPECAVYE